MGNAILIRTVLATILVTSWGSLLVPDACASDPILAVELSLHENTLDSCTTCGCEMKGTLESGSSQRWWMTFAEVLPDRKQVWAVRGPAAFAYCGEGDFKSVSRQFLATRGAPYLIVEVQVQNMGGDVRAGMAKVNWTVSKLDGFNWRGKASYKSSVWDFEWDASDLSEALIPVLLADDRERSSFGVYEVVASLRTKALGSEVTRYGSISVQGDFPGAWILLDGRLAARVVEGAPVLLSPVSEGDHLVTLRDFSNRTIERNVRVISSESAGVHLNFLDGLATGEETELAGIGRNPEGSEEYWRIRDGAVMVHIPAGSFLMGSDDPGSEPDERPQREVYLDDYLIDKTEVTWRQYEKFALDTGASLPPAPAWGRLEAFPLSNTTWEQADAYCSWVGARLPTEAEWEKAARGTDGRTYTWGNVWDPGRCNSISGGMHQPEPVGSFPGCVSPYGVLDMAGSHWQWVQDFYDQSYYEAAPSRNPSGPEDGRLKVRRGGYWMDHPQQLMASRRGKADPGWRNFSHGFRCATGVGGDTE